MNEHIVDAAKVRDGMPENRLSRAENYQRKGWVSLLEARPGKVTAHVTGETGNVYVVEIAAADGSNAACTCPDFNEERLRCKHIAAVANEIELASEQDLREVSQRLPRLRDQLELMGSDDPDGEIEQAKRDPTLLKRLEGEPED